VATRKQRKAKCQRADQHSKECGSRVRQPAIREAQEDRVNEQAALLKTIGGRFGELLAKASVLPPPVPQLGEELHEQKPPLSDEERKELISLAPKAVEDSRLEGIRLMGELRDVVRHLDPRTAMSLISWMNVWGVPGEYFEPASTGSEAGVELLAGVVVSQAPDTNSEPSAADYQRALDLVDEVLAQTNLFLMADAAVRAQVDSAEAQLRHKTLVRRLHMRGESYLEHAEALAREVYGPYEALLRDALGFSVDELIRFVHAATRVVQDDVNGVIERESRRLRDAAARGMRATEESKRQAMADELRDCVDTIHTKVGNAMTFTVDQVLVADPSLSAPLVTAMLSAFSVQIGDCDPALYTWPLDEHPLLRRPVVAFEDGYMVPVPGFVGRDYVALLDCAIAEFAPGVLPSDYLATAAERISMAQMNDVFSGSEVHGSLFYRIGDDRYETDGLVLCENVAVITEAKARRISVQASRGDTRRLQRDLDDAIADGVKQGARVAGLLLDGGPTCFQDKSGSVVLEVAAGQVAEAHVLNPQLTPILDLGSQPAVLASAGVKLAIDSAVPIFLNDLRIIVDCIETPAEFVAYLRWRADQPLEQLLDFDEGDLFGAFLLNEDFRFLKGRPAGLHGYFTTQFDDHYAVGIDAPRGAPKPRKMLPKVVARFVRSQCELRPSGWLDSACAAVNLGTLGLAFVDVKGSEIARRARRKRAAGMLVYGTCALVGIPSEMDWREGLALTRSSMPSDVTDVVFVSEGPGRLKIRWVLSL